MPNNNGNNKPRPARRGFFNEVYYIEVNFLNKDLLDNDISELTETLNALFKEQ